MKQSIKRTAAVLMCGILSITALDGCTSEGTDADNKAPQSVSAESTADKRPVTEPTSAAIDTLDLNVEPTPINYRRLEEELERLYQKNPQNTKTVLAYADILTKLSYSQESNTVLAPLLAEEESEPNAIYIAAQNEYLLGNYEQSKSFYQYPEYKERAESGIEYVYYQTNQYLKVQDMPGEYNGRTAIGKMMRGFVGREPYKVTWMDQEETAIPFLVKDPLPVIEAEINGEKRYFILDTGADDTFSNESVAKELGVSVIASREGEYAGGVQVTTRHGALDTMKMVSC